MIIILEGSNGVGKSTYAKLLSRQLNIPLYRPFKQGNTDLHWNHEPELEQKLRHKFKIPLNTHIEDLMAADFIGSLRPGVILDRSLPSAIAYGRLHAHMEGYYNNSTLCRELVTYWQQLLKPRADTFYVWLRAPYAEAKKRCQDRWFPNKRGWDLLERVFEAIFQQDIQMNKRQINTVEVDLDTGVNSICQLALSK